MLWLPVTANYPSLPIFVNLMMKATCSSETSVFTQATPHNILLDGILEIEFFGPDLSTWFSCHCLVYACS
jgi:hypothetical protein